MKSFSEYIALNEWEDPYAEFLQYERKGRVSIGRDLYFYKSLNPRAFPLWTISPNESDVKKAADKDLKELGRKKAFKDRVGEMKVSKYPKGTYEYSMHLSKGPKGDQLQALTLPLGRTDFFVLPREEVKKFFEAGILKFK